MSAQAVEGYYDFPCVAPAPWRRSGLFVTFVAGIHVGVLLLVLGAAAGMQTLSEPSLLSVRLLAAEPPAVVQPVKPQPAPPAAPRRSVRQDTPPVLAAAQPAETAAPSFVVPPQPAPAAAEPGPAPATVPQASLPVVGARFDADYLQNPKPAYPAMSRRNGEEGRVMLRVRVSCQGLPLSIEVRQSSSYARLDQAARAAVEKWRFVPARQGSEAIEAWVLVPVDFKLDT